MPNPYERLLVDLAEAGVQFVTVGGIACAFNGYVRATEDVDILPLLDTLGAHGDTAIRRDGVVSDEGVQGMQHGA
jgi:hypothetical protein